MKNTRQWTVLAASAAFGFAAAAFGQAAGAEVGGGSAGLSLNIDGAAAMPIVVAVWVVAGILKNAWEKFPNRMIPLLTWVLATVAYVVVTKEYSADGIIQGVLTAAMATGIHSGLKNTIESGAAGPPTGLSKLLMLALGVAAFSGATLMTGTTGCVTAPDGSRQLDIDRVAAGVKVAAYVGTYEAVRSDPDLRVYFMTAEVELGYITDDDDIDWVDVMAIVHRLPVEEFKSERASLYVAAGTMLLSEFGSDVVNLNDIQKVRPVVVALREGIQLGLKQPASPPQ